MYKKTLPVYFLIIIGSFSLFNFKNCSISNDLKPFNGEDKNIAIDNSLLINEGYSRSLNYVNAWLEYSDPKTGLIPRNLNNDISIWNAHDSAADNYPFMVLTSALTDRDLFNSTMKNILKTERQIASLDNKLPDTYSFAKNSLLHEDADIERIIFGSSEYIKDGLLSLTEWLGHSEWSDRLVEIIDAMWRIAPVETRFGNIVSENVEVNGEMLQALSRLYWMTGEHQYLEYAIRLGDYYLLGDNHPTSDFTQLRLRDHGCEIVSGLTELYATVSFVDPDKKKHYQDPLHIMLDRILEVGRNEHGLFYNVVNPQNGEILNDGIADNFGYTLNGFLTVFLIDSIPAYRDAVITTLSSLEEHYKHYNWENWSADGDADAIEGALNLNNRVKLDVTANWIDNEIQFMWSKQDSAYRANTQQWNENGIIEGWHGDGNFARTTLMYCLWKSRGVTIQPWNERVFFGAVTKNGQLLISLQSEIPYQGDIIFDSPRHKTTMNMPLDYPRINQFPEWFTVDKELDYELVDSSSGNVVQKPGQELLNGIEINLQPDERKFLIVRKKKHDKIIE